MSTPTAWSTRRKNGAYPGRSRPISRIISAFASPPQPQVSSEKKMTPATDLQERSTPSPSQKRSSRRTPRASRGRRSTTGCAERKPASRSRWWLMRTRVARIATYATGSSSAPMRIRARSTGSPAPRRNGAGARKQMTANPSKSRSTTTVANTALVLTFSRRLSSHARTTSPARPGRRKLTMKPIASGGIARRTGTSPSGRSEDPPAHRPQSEAAQVHQAEEPEHRQPHPAQGFRHFAEMHVAQRQPEEEGAEGDAGREALDHRALRKCRSARAMSRRICRTRACVLGKRVSWRR